MKQRLDNVCDERGCGCGGEWVHPPEGLAMRMRWMQSGWSMLSSRGQRMRSKRGAGEGRGVIANLPENLAIIVDCKNVTFQAISGLEVIEVELQGGGRVGNEKKPQKEQSGPPSRSVCVQKQTEVVQIFSHIEAVFKPFFHHTLVKITNSQ